jgi:hypothetical protein
MWIKRRDYEELKKVSSKYSDVMKAIHSAENGSVTFCNFGVFMSNSVYNSYSDIVDSLNKEVSDLKKKTLDLQAILDYYKHKCGELMADE